MKNLFVVFLLLFGFNQILIAQRLEFGGSIGALVYKGDLAPRLDPRNAGLGAIVFFRHNVSPVVDLRYQLQVGQIFGKDSRFKSPIASQRKGEFQNTVFEMDAIMEYNFLNYRETPKTFKRSEKWSPYLALGLGVMMFNRLSNDGGIFSPTIPIGFGVKWATSKQWNVGAEFMARKTFTDALDGYSTNDKFLVQRTFTNDQDWYTYFGVMLSYTIYGVHCPENNSGYSHPSH